MGLLGARILRQAKPSSPRAARAGTRRMFFEPLESRELLAVLGLGIQLRSDVNDSPGGVINSVLVGDDFWVQVMVEDKRASPQGVISLPVNLYWDPADLELLNAPSA